MNAIVEQKPSPTVEFRGQLQRMDQEIASALPPHIPVERFMRVVLTAVNASPDLLSADRRTLMESAMKAAQDGLLPDGRDGAFVVFNTKSGDKWIKKVQWMPMIGGILKKVRNSGDLLTISAHVAYENDKFTYILGDDEKIEHEPCMGERGKPRLVYAVAKTKDGGIYREVMTVADVEKVRAVSRAGKAGPWVEWWTEMAKKTVLRRLSKRLPMSSDLDDLVRRDDELYDFKGGGSEGRAAQLFKPVTNPLADDPIEGEVVDNEPNIAAESSPASPAADGGEGESLPPESSSAAPEPAGEGNASPAPEGDGGTSPAAVHDPMDKWREEGARARKAGKSIKNPPLDVRNNPEALAAWREGYGVEEGEA
jgi:recombination protein RecT